MNIDWNNPRTYPVWLHCVEHDRHQRFANRLAGAIVALGLLVGVTYAYVRSGEPQALSVAPLSACPNSDAERDVVELVIKHRGIVTHRECQVISRPHGAALSLERSPL